MAFAFELLAGILLAVNAFWDALLIYAVWRCILFVQTSLRCSRESTREWKMTGGQKGFLASAEGALESVSDDALLRSSNETAVALQERSWHSFPTVQLFTADASGYGLDEISYSRAATSCPSSPWRLLVSFPLNLSEELTTHTRNAHLMKERVFQHCESCSALHCSIEKFTSTPLSPCKFALLGFGETRFDAIQFSIPQRICAPLGSMSGVSAACDSTYDVSQSNEARSDAIVISRRNMHDGILEAGQLIIVKDPTHAVMGRILMNRLAGILSISRCDGAVLTRNSNKWMPVTSISSVQLKSNAEQFLATSNLHLQESFLASRTRRPARRASALEENFDVHVQFHASYGDSLQPVRLSRILPHPPMHAGKIIEIADSKQQECESCLIAETPQKTDEENKQDQLLQQTWWDEDAVLLGEEGEETCNGFEQWQSLPICRGKSLFSVCKSAMTCLASSLSSKSTQ